MKKIITICLVVIFFGSPITLFSQKKFPLQLGLKVAPNLGWMSPGTKDYQNDGVRFGATLGFFGDYYFAENYAFSAGLNFQFLDGAMKFHDSLPNSDTVLIHSSVSRKYNFLYLEIPLLIKMKTKKFGKLSYFGQVGLGTAFRVKATKKDATDPTTLNVGISESFNDRTSLIRESILVGIGCNYHIDESSVVFFGISYSNSLNNVLKGQNKKTLEAESSQLNYVELNLGFLF